MSQIGYYIAIPTKVVLDTKLSPNAKLLFGIIAGLCNQRGYCWATNKFISEIIGVHELTISRMLKELIKFGYVIRFEEIVNGTTQRRLKIDENIKEGYTNESSMGYQKHQPPLDKNVNHNNIIEHINEQIIKQEGFFFEDELSNEAWERWVKYRKEIRKPLSPSTTKSQVEKLRSKAPHTRAEMINRSIENGWQGLFEPNQQRKSGISEEEFLAKLG